MPPCSPSLPPLPPFIAGDQNLIECDNRGCDVDGCQPWYRGQTLTTTFSINPVQTHVRFDSTRKTLSFHLPPHEGEGIFQHCREISIHADHKNGQMVFDATGAATGGTVTQTGASADSLPWGASATAEDAIIPGDVCYIGSGCTVAAATLIFSASTGEANSNMSPKTVKSVTYVAGRGVITFNEDFKSDVTMSSGSSLSIACHRPVLKDLQVGDLITMNIEKNANTGQNTGTAVGRNVNFPFTVASITSDGYATLKETPINEWITKGTGMGFTITRTKRAMYKNTIAIPDPITLNGAATGWVIDGTGELLCWRYVCVRVRECVCVSCVVCVRERESQGRCGEREGGRREARRR